jgi:hypothetical protein
MPFQEQRVELHDAVNTLAVDRQAPALRQLPVHQRSDAAIAIGGPLVDKTADDRQHRVFGL